MQKMGKASILGIEKGKNNELTQYKITVAGPIPPTHANIQFDHLISEMTFMTEVGEVREPKNDSITEIKSIFRSFRREHSPFTKPVVESISTMASQMEMKHSLDWNVLGWNQQKFLNFLTLHHRQKWWVTETYLLLFFKYLFSNLLNHAKICSFQIIDRPSVTWWNV